MTRSTRPPVIVGVDSSEPGFAALDFAVAEAERRGLPLRLVHGFLWPVFAPPPYVAFVAPDLGFDPREEAEKALDAIAADVRTRHPELEVTTAVVSGSPAGVLVAGSTEAGLLVVGSHGRGGFAGLLLGSVSSQVAAHAHCPVVVVRPHTGEDPTVPHRPVLVGVDGSAQSDRAVAFAFEEASLRGTSLVALSVWNADLHLGHPAVLPADADPSPARDEAALALAETLAGYREKYPDVTVHSELVHGVQPAGLLVEATRRAGLVVVGARGRGGFAGMLLGSVSQALLHHAHCPVAVVRLTATR